VETHVKTSITHASWDHGYEGSHKPKQPIDSLSLSLSLSLPPLNPAKSRSLSLSLSLSLHSTLQNHGRALSLSRCKHTHTHTHSLSHIFIFSLSALLSYSISFCSIDYPSHSLTLVLSLAQQYVYTASHFCIFHKNCLRFDSLARFALL
jgi:hypothetical protein